MVHESLSSCECIGQCDCDALCIEHAEAASGVEFVQVDMYKSTTSRNYMHYGASVCTTRDRTKQ
jgi:hypothetical protein